MSLQLLSASQSSSKLSLTDGLEGFVRATRQNKHIRTVSNNRILIFKYSLLPCPSSIVGKKDASSPVEDPGDGSGFGLVTTNKTDFPISKLHQS